MSPGKADPSPDALPVDGLGETSEVRSGIRQLLDSKTSERFRWFWKVTPRILFLLSLAIVLAGQWSLEFITVDDLREAEVAREMLEDGSVVVPHLAGLPFVEKPPGYQILLALAYRVAGGPSLPAARITAALCACLSVVAVFMLGKRLGGPWAGGLAAVTLASSVCFCRTAHTLLLDNALTAALAWGYSFAWRSMDAEHTRQRRLWAAAALATVGLAFLFKGFVGPAIFGASLLLAVAASNRWGDLKPFFHPWVLPAFFLPPLVWLIPFVLKAPPALLHQFFITNHFGRALHAYDSHARPMYYYFASVWLKFAPGSLLLPLAAVAAWKERRHPGGRPAMFLLWASIGGMRLLSLSRAKDDTYLLPIYPCLAGLVGLWAARRPPRTSLAAFRSLLALTLVAFLSALGAIAGVAWLDGLSSGSLAGAAAVGLCLPLLGWSIRVRDSRILGAVLAVWVSISAILVCIPPLSSWYVGRKSPSPTIRLLIAAAGDRELLLYQPEDRIRGGCGFFRNKTALEVSSPADLVDRLQKNNRSVAVVHGSLSIQPSLVEAAAVRGVALVEELHVDWAGLRPLSLVRAAPARPRPAERHP